MLSPINLMVALCVSITSLSESIREFREDISSVFTLFVQLASAMDMHAAAVIYFMR